MADHASRTVQTPDLDAWSRKSYRQAVIDGATAGLFWPGDQGILEDIIDHWSTQPALLRALVTEIVGLIEECRIHPGALEELSGIMKRIG